MDFHGGDRTEEPADANADIWKAFQQLQTYKQQIPSLFYYNEALVISDGVQARIGSLTADKERFMPWRTIDGSELADNTLTQIQVLLQGVFEKSRFSGPDQALHGFRRCRRRSADLKKMAGYHQYHAVNHAPKETIRAATPVESTLAAEPPGFYLGGTAGDRRVGVIWHTQGSGKSLTMAFYAGKVILHPAMENPTIVVITDRNDLDDQLFGTFSRRHELLR